MSSTELVIDTQDIQFVTKEWLHIERLEKYPKYEDFDEETLDLLIKEGHTFAEKVIAPTNVEGDREGCTFKDGQAFVPKCLHAPYKQAYELGWASLSASPEVGGQGVPFTAVLAIAEGMTPANLSLNMYFGLTQGSMELIETFGDEELVKTYCEKMTSGEYTGTMCLSEPQAGSDVGAGTTAAEQIEGKKYKIKGTKCWISSGDNDLGSNVIHLVLARVKGATPGTKGLSLFVVPKIRVNEDGSLGELNDVSLVSIEHKLGIKASSTAVLNFGDQNNCEGFLLGEEGQGMMQMFQMMNDARMGVATMGVTLGSAAYQNTLAYAKERLQFPSLTAMKDPTAPKVPIIEHPDVRLMLTGMKARVEGMRALLYGACHTRDKLIATENEMEREAMDDFYQILTPMCKAWTSEIAVDVARTGVQVLGGVGYTQDFPLEQYYRDLRIAPIYEGTTGIQALDLVSRKMTIKNGKLFEALIGRFFLLHEKHKEHPLLEASVEAWKKAVDRMGAAAMAIQQAFATKGIPEAVLYATPFLHFTSAVTAGYFLIQQGAVAAKALEEMKEEEGIEDDGLADFLKENSKARFYDNKLKTIDFFVNVVIPEHQGKLVPLLKGNNTALHIDL